MKYGNHRWKIEINYLYADAGWLPLCIAHITLNGDSIELNGFCLDRTSHKIIPQLKTSHFSVYLDPSNTSANPIKKVTNYWIKHLMKREEHSILPGAIQAALPMLFVISVALSVTVPKSHIFNWRPSSSNSKFAGFRSRWINGFGSISCK